MREPADASRESPFSSSTRLLPASLWQGNLLLSPCHGLLPCSLLPSPCHGSSSAHLKGHSHHSSPHSLLFPTAEPTAAPLCFCFSRICSGVPLCNHPLRTLSSLLGPGSHVWGVPWPAVLRPGPEAAACPVPRSDPCHRRQGGDSTPGADPCSSKGAREGVGPGLGLTRAGVAGAQSSSPRCLL